MVFKQNSIHGGTLIAQILFINKRIYFSWGLFNSDFLNKPSIDTLVPNIYNDIYIKTEIDTLFSNSDLSHDYTKAETDDLDNELSTLILNTYNKSEIGTFSQVTITLNILIRNWV